MLYDFEITRNDGTKARLGDFQGKVMLLVNTASECGLTPQYDGLEKLHERYADQGLAVLGFPANEFGAQEPGTDAQIAQFCQLRFGVKFPLKSTGYYLVPAALTTSASTYAGSFSNMYLRWLDASGNVLSQM